MALQIVGVSYAPSAARREAGSGAFADSVTAFFSGKLGPGHFERPCEAKPYSRDRDRTQLGERSWLISNDEARRRSVQARRPVVLGRLRDGPREPRCRRWR